MVNILNMVKCLNNGKWSNGNVGTPHLATSRL